jgi:ubiquinone/menaquinone biosynthesis C-methylase UbiE
VSELRRIEERYARRARADDASRYDRLKPWVYLPLQEVERALIRTIELAGLPPLAGRRVLEVGCGSGDLPLELLALGFAAENLVGYELIEERAAAARKRLPAAATIVTGDASDAELDDGSFDVVAQSTVFTSILDPAFQDTLAERMWRLVRPGGGVLWYDFVVDNPRNPDVRGVPLQRVRELFPAGSVHARRVTLAPPLSRLVTRIHPSLYGALNALPPLRTHVLCWIAKGPP